MQTLIADILDALRSHDLDRIELDRLIRARSKQAHDGRRIFAKKRILPFYLEERRRQTPLWHSWNVDEELDARFIRTLKMKPRRTASGVATITVITKPWPCSGSCIFCPCDIRMPKSYLHNEPACQRAERNFFDPYLQVASRLHTLEQMGHTTDKVELIVLGGSWDDYPESYRNWFVCEMFAALNDASETRVAKVELRTEVYKEAGIETEPGKLAALSESIQGKIDRYEITYNEAFRTLYGRESKWVSLESFQQARFSEIEAEHRKNEEAEHRVVGLVMETRPDLVDADSLRALRRIGATKIQMGIQSLDQHILDANGREITVDTIARALQLSRLFGFKTHIHMMVNLFDATPEGDKRDFKVLVGDPRFKPDEIKLYPCALVAGTRLVAEYEHHTWRPYSEEELLDVLCTDLLATPPFCRVSRMIRDISAGDILAGNKKTNLRQLVENRLEGQNVREVRFREVAGSDVELEELACKDIVYETAASTEHFLEWVTSDDSIVGFLRLSLPKSSAFSDLGLVDGEVGVDAAMIREVHIYGTAARISKEDGATQHRGLGRDLVERACSIAHGEGFTTINVISAVGTRQYYRMLGFIDGNMYLHREL